MSHLYLHDFFWDVLNMRGVARYIKKIYDLNVCADRIQIHDDIYYSKFWSQSMSEIHKAA